MDAYTVQILSMSEGIAPYEFRIIRAGEILF